MSLGIYTQPHPDYLVSDTNPVRFTFNGRYGGAQDQKVYIRNNNDTRWYSSISVQPIDTAGLGRVDGTKDGYECRLIAQDLQPVNLQWDATTPGASISLSNLGTSTEGDIITYLPFWIRMAIKSNQPIATIKDLVFRITAKENLIA